MTEKSETDKIEQIKERLQIEENDWLLRGPPPLDWDEWIEAHKQFKEWQQATGADTKQKP